MITPKLKIIPEDPLCQFCRCELVTREIWRDGTTHFPTYCDVCYHMLLAINKPFFWRAQKEFDLENLALTIKKNLLMENDDGN